MHKTDIEKSNSSKVKSKAFLFFKKCFSRLDDLEKHKILKCEFLISILSDQDLTELMQHMHTWNNQMIEALYSMYSIDFILQSNVVTLGNYYFVMHKTESNRLTADHYHTLAVLANRTDLHNPVFVSLDQKGKLIVD